ncbi:MAG: hypothetical protein LUM44_03490 [Pyrinomonadaceae bacterium]|nr:hypothetical protein [Pyrinomonadaceae bacterium]
MKKNNAILGLILAVLTIGVFNLSLNAQSINESRPTPITSGTMSGVVNGSKTYYYSLRAKRGAVITVNAKVAWTRGVSFSLDFRGMRGSDGGQKRCCDGDSYLFHDHGSNGTREIEKSFVATSDDRFLMVFSFNTPNLVYTFKFDGIELDRETVSDSEKEAYQTGDSDIIRVPGNSGNRWVNTGIKVQRGDTVILSATGRVDVSAGWGVHSARGTRNFALMPNYPVNSLTRYGLAAKITSTSGITRQKWSYGDANSMYVTKNGTLYLTVNDDAPEDNSGEFQVKVTVKRGR